MQQRILVVEDDRALARVMRDNLTFEGFQVEAVHDGNAAVGRARAFAPDLILLDLMLPDRDGFELCSVVREHGRIPIIMVTARGQKADKLRGLNLGADDYVTKPFEMDELLARIRAVLRRTRAAVEQVTLGRVRVDFHALKAAGDAGDIHLTHREFEVLRYLAERQERVVHRDELLREIWGPAHLEDVQYLRVLMRQLRQKIEPDPDLSRLLITEPGVGYRLLATGDI